MDGYIHIYIDERYALIRDVLVKIARTVSNLRTLLSNLLLFETIRKFEGVI